MQRQRKFNNRNQKPKKKVSKINPKLLVKKATETESDTFTSSKVFNEFDLEPALLKNIDFKKGIRIR